MKKLAHILACVLIASAAALADSPATGVLAEASARGIAYMATLRNGFTVQFDHREIVQDVSRLYTTTGDRNYVDVPTEEIVSISMERLPSSPPSAPHSSAAEVKSAVAAASDKTLVDSDLINSMIRAESGFNPRAVSPKGARGLMQLMPQTAAKLGVRDSFDPQSNVEGGTRYLRDLLRLYNNDLAKALAAYNAGPQRVEQYHGVPPYRETQAYVANIIRDFNRKKLAARKAQGKKADTVKTQAQKGPAKKALKTSAATPATNPVPGS